MIHHAEQARILWLIEWFQHGTRGSSFGQLIKLPTSWKTRKPWHFWSGNDGSKFLTSTDLMFLWSQKNSASWTTHENHLQPSENKKTKTKELFCVLDILTTRDAREINNDKSMIRRETFKVWYQIVMHPHESCSNTTWRMTQHGTNNLLLCHEMITLQ